MRGRRYNVGQVHVLNKPPATHLRLVITSLLLRGARAHLVHVGFREPHSCRPRVCRELLALALWGALVDEKQVHLAPVHALHRGQPLTLGPEPRMKTP